MPAAHATATTPAAMRAVQFDRFGGPEVLELRSVAVPSPGAREVLVRVHASGLNVKDAWARAGGARFLGRTVFPLRTGFDFAGEVVATGAAAADLAPGQAVWGFLDGTLGGAAAEFLAVRRDWLCPMPRGLGWIEAAAMPLVASTALQALRDRARLQPGQRVLIKGASGGVGSATIQIAKARDAHVTAIATGTGLEHARKLGADVVVDYTRTAPRDIAERFDVFIDAAGGSAYGDYRALLHRGSRWVTVAPDPRIFVLGPITWVVAPLVGEPKLDFVAVRPRRADLEEISGLVEAGLLRMPVTATYRLEEIRAAHDAVAAKHGRGKRVVVISPEAIREAAIGVRVE